MSYAYKCVAAPRRAKKGKGYRTPADALAAAFEAVLSDQAAEGWEYLRTDLAPMEARRGLFGGVVETHQAVMIFRRALGAAAEPAPDFETPARAREDAAIPQLGAARID